MIRIGQQALLCERNDIVDTPETTLYFQEDIAEDIFFARDCHRPFCPYTGWLGP